MHLGTARTAPARTQAKSIAIPKQDTQLLGRGAAIESREVGAVQLRSKGLRGAFGMGAGRVHFGTPRPELNRALGKLSGIGKP